MESRSPASFFIAGGTLRQQVRSYVRRPADDDLPERILRGEFCYVLTARQMGKSSLMVRTARQISELGHSPVVIDLTAIGTAEIDAWYLGLLSRIRQSLGLRELDLEGWWADHAQVSQPQRFSEFLRDVALPAASGQLALFIDEIDSTLGLAFRDDFFAAIRAIYQARSDEPIFERLSVVLLGVATPTDLIQDRARTPFNIGRRIALEEFHYEEASVLEDGLEEAHPGAGASILRRIFYWTNGHPYLTQRLCLAAVESSERSSVDDVVTANFFADEARKDSNLAMVRDRVAATPPGERRMMLRLYSAVLAGRKIPDDDRSIIQNRLELYGLLRVERGFLTVRNQIYRQVFNQPWVRANTPPNRGALVATIAMLSVLIVLATAAYLLQDRRPANLRAEACMRTFESSASATERMQALACIFELNEPQFDTQALQLFFGLNEATQRRFFRLESPGAVGDSLLVVSDRVASALPNIVAPPEGYDYDQELLESMANALDSLSQAGSRERAVRLRIWLAGRRIAADGDWAGAISDYGKVLSNDPQNVAARYDRAVALANLGRSTEALDDLERMLTIAEERREPTPTVAALTAALSSTPQLHPDQPSQASAPAAPAGADATASTPVGASPTPDAAPMPTISPQPAPDDSSASAAPQEFTVFISGTRIIETVGRLIATNPNLGETLSANRGRYPKLLALAGALPIVERGEVTETVTSPSGIMPVASDTLPSVTPTIKSNLFNEVVRETSIESHKDWIYSLAFNNVGTALATAGGDGKVIIWDITSKGKAASLSSRYQLDVSQRTVWSVSWSSDDKQIVTGNSEGQIQIWDALNGVLRNSIYKGSSPIFCVAWSPTGDKIAAGGSDNIIRILSVNTNSVQELLGHESDVLGIAWSNDGRLLASGSSDNTVRIWNVESNILLHVLRGHKDWVRNVQFSPDNNTIASAGRDNTMRIWNVSDGSLLQTLDKPTGYVYSVAFHPNGQVVAGASDENIVFLWIPIENRILQVIQPEGNSIAIAWSKDGQFLAIGGYKMVSLWRVSY